MAKDSGGQLEQLLQVSLRAHACRAFLALNSKSCHPLFKSFDRNNSLFLNAKDLALVLPEADPWQLQLLVARFDLDKDNSLSYMQFHKAFFVCQEVQELRQDPALVLLQLFSAQLQFQTNFPENSQILNKLVADRYGKSLSELTVEQVLQIEDQNINPLDAKVFIASLKNMKHTLENRKTDTETRLWLNQITFSNQKPQKSHESQLSNNKHLLSVINDAKSLAKQKAGGVQPISNQAKRVFPIASNSRSKSPRSKSPALIEAMYASVNKSSRIQQLWRVQSKGKQLESYQKQAFNIKKKVDQIITRTMDNFTTIKKQQPKKQAVKTQGQYVSTKAKNKQNQTQRNPRQSRKQLARQKDAIIIIDRQSKSIQKKQPISLKTEQSSSNIRQSKLTQTKNSSTSSSLQNIDWKLRKSSRSRHRIQRLCKKYTVGLDTFVSQRWRQRGDRLLHKYIYGFR